MDRTKLLLAVISILLLSAFVLLAQQQRSYDYESMSMDEYRAELANWQQRLADAESAIAQEEARIQQLQQEIAALDEQIQNEWNEIYALLGTDEAGFQEFVNRLKTLENNLNGFAALSPEEIFSRRDELEQYRAQFEEMKKDKRILGPDAFETSQRIESLFQQIDEKMRSAVVMYEVQRGDYLWRIARKPDIYGDPYAWIRIYTANRDQIQNPDLIYPRQVFRCPKVPGANEHWVERGEYLAKIAGYSNVYGNPFEWNRIYQANREVISDPNLIYPHMILTVPR